MKMKTYLFEATKERVRRGGSKAKIRPHEFVITTQTAEEYFDLLYLFVVIQGMYRERKFGKIFRELPTRCNVDKLCRNLLTGYRKLKMKEPTDKAFKKAYRLTSSFDRRGHV